MGSARGGPVSTEKRQQLIDQGRLDPDTDVRRPDPAVELEDLNAAVAAGRIENRDGVLIATDAPEEAGVEGTGNPDSIRAQGGT